MGATEITMTYLNGFLMTLVMGCCRVYYVDFRLETFQPVTGKNIVNHSVNCKKSVCDKVHSILEEHRKVAVDVKTKVNLRRIRLRFEYGSETYLVDKEGNFQSQTYRGTLPDAAVVKLNRILFELVSPTERALPPPK
jgi:hypothetical protein